MSDINPIARFQIIKERLSNRSLNKRSSRYLITLIIHSHLKHQNNYAPFKFDFADYDFDDCDRRD